MCNWRLEQNYIFCFEVLHLFFFFVYCNGNHRDLHRVVRRQRQMCIRDRGDHINAKLVEDAWDMALINRYPEENLPL